MVVFLAGNISSSPERQHHHHSGGQEHSHGANEHGHTHEFMSNPGLWTDRDKIVNRSDWKQVSLNLLLQIYSHAKCKVMMKSIEIKWPITPLPRKWGGGGGGAEIFMCKGWEYSLTGCFA